MRIDIVTIFPAFFDVLDVSLIGKARDRGILDMNVHDLRNWTHDRHRTVDDTPYGGGAGMVMKPEPWGEALDELLTDDAVLLVPSPAGELFSQRMARSLADERHLVFAWGDTRGSISGSWTTTRRRAGSASSASATTCSTAARSPRWLSWRRS